MPMTPWHVGPGLAFKAVAGRHMSLGVFCVAQVLMDVTVVARLLTRTPPIHGYSHTILGGAAMAALAVGLTVPAVNTAQRLVMPGGSHPGARPWLSWRAAWAGALIGTWSHVVLDSIMHPDVRPLWPLTDWSPLYKVIGNYALHELCFWSGAVGAVAWAVLWVWRKTRHA